MMSLSVSEAMFAVLALLLVIITSAQHIQTHPKSQIVAPGDVFSFTCIGTGDLRWWINGFRVAPDNEDYFKRTLCLSEFIKSNLGNMKFNITVTGVASLDQGKANNETSVFCKATLDHNSMLSDSAELIIADRPLPPPTPQLMVLNATALLLSWFPPYTWLPKYPVLNYDVIVWSTVGIVETHTIEANQSSELQSFVYTQENIAESCNEIELSVSATSLVGESNSSAAVTGGFPIVPGPFPSGVIVNVSIEQSSSIVVKLNFEIVTVCSYQQASYKAIFTNTGIGNVFEVGPFNYQNMSVDDNNMTKIEVIGLLEQEQSYSCTIVIETITGAMYSDAVAFTTTLSTSLNTETSDSYTPTTDTTASSTAEATSDSFMSTTEAAASSTAQTSDTTGIQGNTMIVVAVSSVIGGCIFILLIANLFMFICYHYKWKYKIRNAAPQNGANHMVTNPIYETADGPVYETIDDFNVGGLAEVRYQDMPAMRREYNEKSSEEFAKMPWSDFPEDDSYITMNSVSRAQC